jgi:hypothetical protein
MTRGRHPFGWRPFAHVCWTRRARSRIFRREPSVDSRSSVHARTVTATLYRSIGWAELDEFNRQIEGLVQVIGEFRKAPAEQLSRSTDWGDSP